MSFDQRPRRSLFIDLKAPTDGRLAKLSGIGRRCHWKRDNSRRFHQHPMALRPARWGWRHSATSAAGILKHTSHPIGCGFPREPFGAAASHLSTGSLIKRGHGHPIRSSNNNINNSNTNNNNSNVINNKAMFDFDDDDGCHQYCRYHYSLCELQKMRYIILRCAI